MSGRKINFNLIFLFWVLSYTYGFAQTLSVHGQIVNQCDNPINSVSVVAQGETDDKLISSNAIFNPTDKLKIKPIVFLIGVMMIFPKHNR